MNKKLIFTLFTLNIASFLFSQTQDEGKIFKFKHKLNDSTKILSTVDEKVYINKRFVNTATIVNRITSHVEEVFDDESAKISANFMTTEKNSSYMTSSTWGEEFYSEFIRDKTGKYTISDEYFMPTVRDVPVFPETPIKKGQKWQAKGTEAHDLRHSFNIEKPYQVPFTANYEYLWDELSSDGKNLSVIKCSYSMYFKNPYKIQYLTEENRNFPEITMGFSNQKIWWDNEKGMIDHYTEDFEITIMTFGRDTIKFTGRAKANVTEFFRESTSENLEKLSSSINEMGLENVDVKQSEKGITISIENIQFEPDSAILRSSEKEKLSKIADLLKNFSNDLLITGHCADRGTKESQMSLSEQRANVVATFLKNLNVRKEENLYIQGKGATEPLASNETEEGRMKNRRVEITIMD